MACPRCRAALAADARFCSSCGLALNAGAALDSQFATTPRGVPASPAASTGYSPAWSPSPSPSLREAASRTPAAPADFVAGTLVADRYRIVGTVGRGGMGEVFRADDLKLQQSVALKFLPIGLETEPARLDRLFAEVRLARQISHTAVCRVFDIGEYEGRHYLTMEYIDGENLGSLLRRVGRVPKERAIEMARQLCAGLAAAHDKGILHRDLKPQNVLVDGKGQVHIVDFGLAAVAEALGGEEVRSGTPAYMAPEQVTGKEVSVRSDIYSLGLVLYELFTGRRAISGKTLAEVTRAHQDEFLESPSQIVSDMDPAVERAILRCLEKDPHLRPRSALAVAAALPGGDPVAAALAAGETPSPQMVAALGRGEVMPKWLTFACVAVVAAVIAIAPHLTPHGRLTSLVPMTKAPAVLADRAQELLAAFDPGAPVGDWAAGFDIDEDFGKYYSARKVGIDLWHSLASGDPAVLLYWYRVSPRPIVVDLPTGEVTWIRPVPIVAGMAGVQLDTTGRLVSFYRVPPQLEDAASAPVEAAPAVTTATDWNALFTAARLDMSKFKAVTPRWTPPTYADTRMAWEGQYAARADPLRVEAASYRGQPVSFQLVGPWTLPEREKNPHVDSWGSTLFFVLFAVCLVSGIVLAKHNLMLGRSDRRGALRFSLYIFCLGLVGWAVSAHHVASGNQEFYLTIMGLGLALFMAVGLGLIYLAVEPYVRRLWPNVLVSWSRLVAGGYQDPLVGQDLLIGTAVGTAMGLAIWFFVGLSVRFGGIAPPPQETWVDMLLGPRQILGILIDRHLSGIFTASLVILEIVLLRLLLRREWLAAAAFVLLFTAPRAMTTPLPPTVGLVLYAVVAAVLWVVVLRFGFIAAIVAFSTIDVVLQTQWSTNLSDWTAQPTIWVSLVLMALALYGFWAAHRGKPTVVF